VGWNDHTSWPVRAGHGCIACASPRFWDTMSPFYDRVPNVPGFGVEVTAGEIGLGLVAATVAGVTAHGLIQLIKPAPKPGPPPPGPGDTDKPEEPVLTGKGKQNGAPGR
jgi:hydrogenase small subunit